MKLKLEKPTAELRAANAELNVAARRSLAQLKASGVDISRPFFFRTTLETAHIARAIGDFELAGRAYQFVCAETEGIPASLLCAEAYFGYAREIAASNPLFVCQSVAGSATYFFYSYKIAKTVINPTALKEFRAIVDAEISALIAKIDHKLARKIEREWGQYEA